VPAALARHDEQERPVREQRADAQGDAGRPLLQAEGACGVRRVHRGSAVADPVGEHLVAGGVGDHELVVDEVDAVPVARQTPDARDDLDVLPLQVHGEHTAVAPGALEDPQRSVPHRQAAGRTPGDALEVPSVPQQ
jgi:hypothetical protein